MLFIEKQEFHNRDMDLTNIMYKKEKKHVNTGDTICRDGTTCHK